MDLVGRALAIPASIRALQWIDGYALLLAYVGSRFVLEVILGR